MEPPITGDRSQVSEPSVPQDASGAATHALTDTGRRFNDVDAVTREQYLQVMARHASDTGAPIARMSPDVSSTVKNA